MLRGRNCNHILVYTVFYIFPDGLKADGSISVFNAARLRTPDGKLTIINGTATILDPSEPGKLSVSFDSVGTAGAPCKCFSRCYRRCSNPSHNSLTQLN